MFIFYYFKIARLSECTLNVIFEFCNVIICQCDIVAASFVKFDKIKRKVIHLTSPTTLYVYIWRDKKKI